MSEIMITGRRATNINLSLSDLVIREGNVGITEGFGFVDFAIIDQHFVQRHRQNRLLNLVIEHNLPGIGIDESTAIILSNGCPTFEVLGQRSVMVFEPRLAETPRTDALRNLSVDAIETRILLSGDSYTVAKPFPSVAEPVEDNAGNGEGHLFLHGGGTTFSVQQREEFVALAGGAEARILVVPLAASNPATRGATDSALFNSSGATADYIVFDKGEADETENLKKLDSVTGVWFSNGDHNLLTDMLLGTAFLERIKEIYRQGGTVGGMGLTATALSEIMITGEEALNTTDVAFPYMREGNVVTAEGLGFIDFAIIDERFIQRKMQNRLMSAVLENNLAGIGIDQNTAVIFSGGRHTFRVLGSNSVMLLEPRLTALPKTDALRNLSADVIEMRIFLSGDSATIVHQNPLGIIKGANRNTCPANTVELSVKGVESASFQWYRNDTLIANATHADYTATQSGIYTVAFGEGTISPPKTVTIDRCFAYEEFLGNYTMHYSVNASNPTATRTLPVTLVEAVHGQSYHLKGILVDADESEGVIEVLFNAKQGKIEIPGNRILSMRDIPGQEEFWLLTIRTDGSNNRLTVPLAGLMSTDYEFVNDELKSFNTTCRIAPSGTQPSMGFLLRNFPAGASSPTVNVQHRGGEYRVYYPRFERE